MKTKIFVLAMLAVLVLVSCASNKAWEYHSKGMRYLDWGIYDVSIKYFDKAIEIEPDLYIAWTRKGNALVGLGNYEDAILCYNKALEIKPDFLFGWTDKAYLYYNLEEFEKSLECYDKAIEIDTTDIDLWRIKGDIFKELERYKSALSCYNMIIVILDAKGSNMNLIESIRMVETYYDLAQVYSLLNDKNEMIKHLKVAILLNNNNREYSKEDNDFKEYWDDPDFIELTR